MKPSVSSIIPKGNDNPPYGSGYSYQEIQSSSRMALNGR
jgi:hypothetical protein